MNKFSMAWWLAGRRGRHYDKWWFIFLETVYGAYWLPFYLKMKYRKHRVKR